MRTLLVLVLLALPAAFTAAAPAAAESGGPQIELVSPADGEEF